MAGLILAGALVGVGLTVMLAGLRVPAPDLRLALARLSALTDVPAGRVAVDAHGSSDLDRWLARLAEALGLSRHRADLALVGTRPSRMALQKLGYGMVGLVFPLLMSSILTIAGVDLPFGVPMAAGVLLCAAMSFLPEAELRRRAALARLELRRTVCVYLELVALERSADAGPVEALERAAAVGQGAGFAHIREALLRARLEGRTPWQQLSGLAEELHVPELGDVADIMRLSGEDGAAVLPTLRARAASLRTSLLQSEVAAANEASERMSVPVALLGVAFMALLGFPALWRILFG